MTHKNFFLLFSINSINAKDIQTTLEETLEETKESILTTLKTKEDIILTETNKKTKIFITVIGGLISILTAIVLYNKFFKEKKTNGETTEKKLPEKKPEPMNQYEIIKSIVNNPINKNIYNEIKQKNSKIINFQYLEGCVFSSNDCNFLGNGNYINLKGDDLKEENIIARVLNSLKNFVKDQVTFPIVLYFDKEMIDAFFKNTEFQNYNNQLKIYVKIKESLNDAIKNSNNNVTTIVNNLVDIFNNSKKNWPYDKIAYYISIPTDIKDKSLIKDVLYYFNEYMKKHMGTNSLLLFSPVFTN